MEALQNFGSVNQTLEPTESINSLNSYNYFCVFCLRETLFSNQGNFSKCQECCIMHSNFGADCSSCGLVDQYIYWRHDFETGKGDSPATAVCSKCTGVAMWSGEAPQI